MTTKVRERLVSPIGEAKWAHIHQPKAPFRENGQDKGEPKFQIDVVFEKTDPAWAAWAKAIMTRIRAMKAKNVPIKEEMGLDDVPTGRFYVTFKSSQKYKPGVFDRYGLEITEDKLIGNGSKVRVNYTPNEYQGFGGGINFYLNAVQVIELVEYKPHDAKAYGFETESPPPPSDFGEPASDVGATADANIPF